MIITKSIIPAILLAAAFGVSTQAEEGVLSRLFDRHPDNSTEVKAEPTQTDEKPALETGNKPDSTEKMPCKNSETKNTVSKEGETKTGESKPGESKPGAPKDKADDTHQSKPMTDMEPQAPLATAESNKAENSAEKTVNADNADKTAKDEKAEKADKEDPNQQYDEEAVEGEIWVCQECPYIIIVRHGDKTTLIHRHKPLDFHKADKADKMEGKSGMKPDMHKHFGHRAAKEESGYEPKAQREQNK